MTLEPGSPLAPNGERGRRTRCQVPVLRGFLGGIIWIMVFAGGSHAGSTAAAAEMTAQPGHAEPVVAPPDPPNAETPPSPGPGPCDTVGHCQPECPEAPPQPPALPTPEAALSAEEKVRPDTFLDRTQVFLSRLFSDPAVWFDSFFADQRYLEEVPSGTFVRWRNALRWSEDKDFFFFTQFNASLRLPRMKRKLRLVITSDTEEDKFAPDTGAVLDPAFATAADQKKSNAGLLYDIYETVKSKVNFGVGIRLRGPVQPFVRMRFRYLQPLGALWLARFTETAYEKTHDGFSEITQLDFDRTLNQSTLLRISNAVTYTETKNGIEWVPAVSVLHQLSPKDAISYDVSALLVNRPERVMQNYRVGTRYRRNFYRPWLFLELEPEITWPLDENNTRRSIKAFTFLIEVQFERPK